MFLGAREQGNLVRERRVQLWNRRVGGSHQEGSLGGAAPRAGHLLARGDEGGSPRDPRGCPCRHRVGCSGVLGRRAPAAAGDV